MSETSARWTQSRNYLMHVRRLARKVESGYSAIEYLSYRAGLRGYRIAERVTGTKALDGFEISAVEAMERVEAIRAGLPLAEAELEEAMAPIRKLAERDQRVLEREYLSKKRLDERTERPTHKRMTTEERDAELERLMEPFHALGRLYEVLPPEWKLPKAI